MVRIVDWSSILSDSARFLLLGSSFSMGGISIWSMHFIGDRAISLGDDQPQLQIVYSAGFTMISFFVPVLVVLLAFASVGSNDTMNTTRVVLGGALTGFAVCGMHYLAQAGISNYECLYPIPFVVGAFIIAVSASIAALCVFFLYRLSWDTRWWRRPICAIVLASAVSGMHWITSIGTQYRLKGWGPSTTGNLSRASTVIIVLVLVSQTPLFFYLIILTLPVYMLLRSLGAHHVTGTMASGKTCEESSAGCACDSNIRL